jgi:hypothetical protein
MPNFSKSAIKQHYFYRKPISIRRQLEKMGQKLGIFKIWPPDFAQKNIFFILNLSKTTCELILPKKIFFVKIPIFEKNVFCVKNCS